MSILRIAIDGACRRNGKPDCVSAGGVFVLHYLKNNLRLLQTHSTANYEVKSTNQRGELIALIAALEYIHAAKIPAQIVTDSEYLFNTMTKEWYKNWQRKGWVTSLDEPVKNRDVWEAIIQALSKCTEDITFYHIKGHCIPFGKVTASRLLQQDSSGLSLYNEVSTKYDALYETKIVPAIDDIQQLSEKNNGFELPHEQLKAFIVANIVADAVATRCVEAADALGG